jgi:ATP-dependent RNA helicase RhlE
MNFSELGLHPSILRGCEALGYKEPTPIQAKSIPAILEGADLIGCAETGTGKTAAFLLPILQRILETPRPGLRALIIAPTRELVSQIHASYIKLAPRKSGRCVGIIGGASMARQCEMLRRGAAVVVATPGRLIDHIDRGSIDLSQIEVLVMDEADRMLDMGFLPAIRRVLATLPESRQNLLFSATMAREVESLARSMMKNPRIVEAGTRGRAAVTVDQKAFPVATESKTALLLDLLDKGGFERVLVFTRTRRGAERLSHILQAREHKADRIHADRSQSQRNAALQGFKNGKTRVLVATDIAARGIDVDLVSHVINYDVPESPEDYVHRIGRTGRAGNHGEAMTLIAPGEELSMRAIERLTGRKIERVLIPEFGGVKTAAATDIRPSGAGMRRSAVGRRSFRPRRAGR